MMKTILNSLISLPIIVTLLTASFVVSITSPGMTSSVLANNENQDIVSETSQKDYLSLVSVRASAITAGTRNTEYYFTINIPKSSQPLQKINIVQRGGLDIIEFNHRRTRAYGVGKTKQEINISEIKSESNSQGITVTFEPVVEAGQKLTLVMGVKENPLNDGNYLFGVTVFSPGKSDLGQSLGIGRLRITSIL